MVGRGRAEKEAESYVQPTQEGDEKNSGCSAAKSFTE